MTSDDSTFFDVLSAVPTDIRRYSSDVADAVDRHFEQVAAQLREVLSSATWIPQSARPAPRPPVPVRVAPPLSYLEFARGWVSRNRALAAAVIAFVGTGAVLIYSRRRSHTRRRRAKRANNGARKEVVVIAGSPSSSVTRSISLDLERRGFIVYVAVNSEYEEQNVRNESRVDIRPLHLDITDTTRTEQTIERFKSLLQQPHHAFAGATPHHLNFTGLILAPDLVYPSGPVETVVPELWSDALNAKVLGTIATAQAFLRTVSDFKARVLILTPNIISSLRPPFHAVESTVVGALDAFSASLSGELATLDISVCHLKLGTFNLSSIGGRQQLQALDAARTQAWSASARATYAQNFVAQSRITGSRGLSSEGGSTAGSPLRELHNAVFDALTQKRPRRVWRVGRGSFAYDLIGSWVPAGVIGWMLGIRRVSWEESAENTSQVETGSQSLQWEKVDVV